MHEGWIFKIIFLALHSASHVSLTWCRQALASFRLVAYCRQNLFSFSIFSSLHKYTYSWSYPVLFSGNKVTNRRIINTQQIIKKYNRQCVHPQYKCVEWSGRESIWNAYLDLSLFFTSYKNNVTTYSRYDLDCVTKNPFVSVSWWKRSKHPWKKVYTPFDWSITSHLLRDNKVGFDSGEREMIRMKMKIFKSLAEQKDFI